MTEANTYSWIFFAIAAISQQGAVKLSEVTPVADGINHAIPTQKEIRNSLSWLEGQSLVEREGKRVLVTPEGKSLFARISGKPGGTMKTWDRLTAEFTKLGADDEVQIDC